MPRCLDASMPTTHAPIFVSYLSLFHFRFLFYRICVIMVWFEALASATFNTSERVHSYTMAEGKGKGKEKGKGNKELVHVDGVTRVPLVRLCTVGGVRFGASSSNPMQPRGQRRRSCCTLTAEARTLGT